MQTMSPLTRCKCFLCVNYAKSLDASRTVSTASVCLFRALLTNPCRSRPRFFSLRWNRQMCYQRYICQTQVRVYTRFVVFIAIGYINENRVLRPLHWRAVGPPVASHWQRVLSRDSWYQRWQCGRADMEGMHGRADALA